jgi:hypothetical protein
MFQRVVHRVVLTKSHNNPTFNPSYYFPRRWLHFVIRKFTTKSSSDKEYLDGEIMLKKFKAVEFDKMADFLLANFFPYEPMGVALGLKVQNELHKWFHKYIKTNLALSPPVSSKAINTSTGELVGVNFASIFDPMQPKPPGLLDFIDPLKSPNMFRIGKFLDGIEEGKIPGHCQFFREISKRLKRYCVCRDRSCGTSRCQEYISDRNSKNNKPSDVERQQELLEERDRETTCSV